MDGFQTLFHVTSDMLTPSLHLDDHLSLVSVTPHFPGSILYSLATSSWSPLWAPLSVSFPQMLVSDRVMYKALFSSQNVQSLWVISSIPMALIIIYMLMAPNTTAIYLGMGVLAFFWESVQAIAFITFSGL